MRRGEENRELVFKARPAIFVVLSFPSPLVGQAWTSAKFSTESAPRLHPCQQFSADTGNLQGRTIRYWNKEPAAVCKHNGLPVQTPNRICRTRGDHVRESRI